MKFESQPETPKPLSTEIAVALYTDRKVTMGQAARIAGISQPAFLHELGRRNICVNYDVEDFEADLKTLSRLEK